MTHPIKWTARQHQDKRDLDRLRRLWATQRATRAEIMRCMDLERELYPNGKLFKRAQNSSCTSPGSA